MIHVIIYRIMFCFVFTFNSLSHCEVISIWTSDCVDIGPVMVSFWPLLVSWLFFIWEILPKYHLCNSQNCAFVNYGDNFFGDIELILVSHLVNAVDLHSIQWNSCNFLSEISIMHFAFPLLKINPLLLTFLWVNIPLTLYVSILVTHDTSDWFIVNHSYYETW